jgi:hypothetical protein
MNCTLKPGEVCLMCGSVGAEPPPKVKRVAKAKPGCHVCGEPLTRARKRRLWRGKWVHTDCV